MRNIMLLKIKFVCIRILYKFYFTKEILFLITEMSTLFIFFIYNITPTT